MASEKAIVGQCDEIELAWRDELSRWEDRMGFYQGHIDMYKGKTGVAFVKYAKNRIKRCKWNITRAINLRKKHE